MDPKTAAGVTGSTAALRSQLNQIAAASQLLESGVSAQRGRTYLSAINQGICRMLRIIGRMELEQRLTEEPASLSLTCIDLPRFFEDLGGRLEGILAAIGVRFTVSCPPLLLYADRELLTQLLLELTGHLALAGTQITLTVTHRDRNIHMTLSDCGPGCADGRPVLPELLESEEEQTALRIARRIAELHGGTLILSPGSEQALSLAVSLPTEDEAHSGLLEEPSLDWNSGGFDPALVALSHLLPASSFLPEQLD